MLKKKNTRSRIASFILAGALALSLLPGAAFAEPAGESPAIAPAGVGQAAVEPMGEAPEALSPEPAAEPDIEPTGEPTGEPTSEPTAEPGIEPTAEPGIEPTTQPTAEPIGEPIAGPAETSEVKPTAQPTETPMEEAAAGSLVPQAAWAEKMVRPANNMLSMPVSYDPNYACRANGEYTGHVEVPYGTSFDDALAAAQLPAALKVLYYRDDLNYQYSSCPVFWEVKKQGADGKTQYYDPYVSGTYTAEVYRCEIGGYAYKFDPASTHYTITVLPPALEVKEEYTVAADLTNLIYTDATGEEEYTDCPADRIAADTPNDEWTTIYLKAADGFDVQYAEVTVTVGGLALPVRAQREYGYYNVVQTWVPKLQDYVAKIMLKNIRGDVVINAKCEGDPVHFEYYLLQKDGSLAQGTVPYAAQVVQYRKGALITRVTGNTPEQRIENGSIVEEDRYSNYIIEYVIDGSGNILPGNQSWLAEGVKWSEGLTLKVYYRPVYAVDFSSGPHAAFEGYVAETGWTLGYATTRLTQDTYLDTLTSENPNTPYEDALLPTIASVAPRPGYRMDGWQIAYIWPDSTPKGDGGEYYKVGDILSLEEIKAMGTVYSPTVFTPAVAEIPAATPTPSPEAMPTPSPEATPALTPAPGGDPDPTPPPAAEPMPVPAAVTPAAPAGPPAGLQAPEEAIPEADVPLAEAPQPQGQPGQQPEEEPIEDQAVPLAGPRQSAWALLNLILTVLTVLGSAVLLVTWFTRRKQHEEEQEEATEREQRKEVDRHGLVRLFSLIPALGAVIAFVLTENMKNPMVFTDKWTLLMAAIFVIQLVVMLLARKNYDSGENGPDKGPAAANV